MEGGGRRCDGGERERGSVRVEGATEEGIDEWTKECEGLREGGREGGRGGREGRERGRVMVDRDRGSVRVEGLREEGTGVDEWTRK